MPETHTAHVFEDKKRTDDVLIQENVSFAGLLLSDPILQGLKNAGFHKPSPIQLKAIPLGRCGLDLIVQAKSGTGKTCVFSVITLEGVITQTRSLQTLVLAPTREIAVQIHDVVQNIGSCFPDLKCYTFIGGMPLNEDKQKLKKCHIAIGTPGRIKQLIEEEIMSVDNIRLFILDEADKLLEEQFQSQINWIYSSLPENKQMLALSATYPEYMAQHLKKYMRNPTFVRLNSTDPALLGVKQFYQLTAFHPLPHVAFEHKVKHLVNLLSSVTFHQCLIFSNLQSRAETLSNFLNSKGLPSTCIAGCLEQKQRLEAMAKLRNFQCRVLISTDLTSRGIDVDKINLVINLDLPKDHETYLHRIGRAGRFGSYGVAITYVCRGKEDENLKTIESMCNTYIQELPDPTPSDLVKNDKYLGVTDLVTTEQIMTQPMKGTTVTAEQTTALPQDRASISPISRQLDELLKHSDGEPTLPNNIEVKGFEETCENHVAQTSVPAISPSFMNNEHDDFKQCATNSGSDSAKLPPSIEPEKKNNGEITTSLTSNTFRDSANVIKYTDTNKTENGCLNNILLPPNFTLPFTTESDRCNVYKSLTYEEAVQDYLDYMEKCSPKVQGPSSQNVANTIGNDLPAFSESLEGVDSSSLLVNKLHDCPSSGFENIDNKDATQQFSVETDVNCKTTATTEKSEGGATLNLRTSAEELKTFLYSEELVNSVAQYLDKIHLIPTVNTGANSGSNSNFAPKIYEQMDYKLKSGPDSKKCESITTKERIDKSRKEDHLRLTTNTELEKNVTKMILNKGFCSGIQSEITSHEEAAVLYNDFEQGKTGGTANGVISNPGVMNEMAKCTLNSPASETDSCDDSDDSSDDDDELQECKSHRAVSRDVEDEYINNATLQTRKDENAWQYKNSESGFQWNYGTYYGQDFSTYTDAAHIPESGYNKMLYNGSYQQNGCEWNYNGLDGWSDASAQNGGYDQRIGSQQYCNISDRSGCAPEQYSHYGQHRWGTLEDGDQASKNDALYENSHSMNGASNSSHSNYSTAATFQLSDEKQNDASHWPGWREKLKPTNCPWCSYYQFYNQYWSNYWQYYYAGYYV